MTTDPQPTLLLERIPLDKLVQHPNNIRRHVGDLTDLAKSIEGVGVLEPLLVLPANDEGLHLVVAGNRRLAASIKAKGVDDAPAIVRDLTEAEVLEAMLVENLQRNDLTAIEEAKAYGRLVELDSTVVKIAAKVGRSQKHVKGRLALLALPDSVLDLVDDGTMDLGTANDLLPFAGDEEAVEWLAKEAKGGARMHNLAYALEQHVKDRDLAAMVAEVRAKVEEAGHTLFVPPVDQYQREQPPQHSLSSWDTMKLTKPASVEGAMEFTKAQAKKHGDEPCSAIWIRVERPYYGSQAKPKVTAVHICTDPKRHTTKATKATKSELQMKPAIYARKSSSGKPTGPAPKLLKAMKLARTDHTARAIAKVRKLDDESLALVLAALDLSAGEGCKWAGEYLDPTGEAGSGYESFRLAMADPEQLHRALLALAVGNLRRQDWDAGAKARLTAWLVSTGYEPIEGEQPWVDADVKAHERKVAQRAKDAAATRAKLAKAKEKAAPPEPEQLAEADAGE